MSTSTLTSRPEFAGILKNREVFAIEDDDSVGNRVNGWFDDLMLQSGVQTSPSMMLAVSACAAIVAGGAAFVVREDLVSTTIASVIGLALPVLIAVICRSRRKRLLSQQLPEMIDELARAAKSGRSLEKALMLVAHDTPSPLGRELLDCTRKLEMGMTIPAAFDEFPRRTGLVATRILVTALAVHVQTGGNLVEVLERLSLTLRSRALFLGRLHAATAASRATAVLMLALPPAILGFFVFRDSDYLTNLFASDWGTRVTVLAFALQTVGAVWVLQVLKSSQRV